jgi:hypothetical protein
MLDFHNLAGKYERKRTLGKPKNRWEDVNMALNKIGVVYMARIYLAQDWGQWQVLKFWVQ